MNKVGFFFFGISTRHRAIFFGLKNLSSRAYYFLKRISHENLRIRFQILVDKPHFFFMNSAFQSVDAANLSADKVVRPHKLVSVHFKLSYYGY